LIDEILKAILDSVSAAGLTELSLGIIIGYILAQIALGVPLKPGRALERQMLGMISKSLAKWVGNHLSDATELDKQRFLVLVQEKLEEVGKQFLSPEEMDSLIEELLPEQLEDKVPKEIGTQNDAGPKRSVIG
jgi:ParB-like chromosome segregation protein Spo0J